jgi:hypothetical protein
VNGSATRRAGGGARAHVLTPQAGAAGIESHASCQCRAATACPVGAGESVLRHWGTAWAWQATKTVIEAVAMIATETGTGLATGLAKTATVTVLETTAAGSRC